MAFSVQGNSSHAQSWTMHLIQISINMMLKMFESYRLIHILANKQSPQDPNIRAELKLRPIVLKKYLQFH